MRPRPAGYVLISLFIYLLVACGGESGLNSDQHRSFDIEPQFREFYDSLGGEENLGAAISPFFFEGDLGFQYTVSGLMVFDARREGNQSFYMAALGREMDIPWYKGGARVVDIYPEFRSAYDRLGGTAICGEPLTGPRYNPQKHRYEQYLETVGFYRLETEPPGTVHFLAYGSWKCGNTCSLQASPEAAVALPPRIDERFEEAVKTLGTDFTGFPLTDGYLNPDGSLEQIFENVVLYIHPNGSGPVYLATMSERLGIVPDLMREPGNVEGATFIPVKDDKGYLVTNDLMEFINQRGGLQLTGLPIGELMDLGDGIRRQCFHNLCLEIDGKVSDALRIRPYPLGYTYAQLNLQSGRPDLATEAPSELFQIAPATVDPLSGAPPLEEISLQVREVHPWVGPKQQQEIVVTAYENGRPANQAQLQLVLQLPGGNQKVYPLPPTNESGQTSILLEAIDAPSGTIIPYQLCTSLGTEGTYCVRDEFLIWVAP